VKTILLTFCLLTALSAHGQLKEVHSLNIDSCWVDSQSLYDRPLKWVNFSTQTVGAIEGGLVSAVADYIDREYASLLKSEHQSSEALFHCGSQQSSLVVNIDFGSSRVCAWVRLDGESPKIERVGLEPLAHDGYCYGAVFKEAILSIPLDGDEQRTLSFIQEWLRKYDVELVSTRSISNRVILLSFSESIMIAQEKILNELSLELKASGLARGLDLNYYQVEAGEFHPLN